MATSGVFLQNYCTGCLIDPKKTEIVLYVFSKMLVVLLVHVN